MEIQLKLGNGLFEAANEKGAVIKLGAGLPDGVTPMEALLMAAGACSGLDMVAILTKMRQPLEGLEISVAGRRREEHPKYFEELTLKYVLKGDLDGEKVERAINLSLDKYCSVTNGIKQSAKIHYEYSIERKGD